MSGGEALHEHASLPAGARSALNVALLAGGRSSEHEVSLSSAAAVREGLEAGGHEVHWIEVGRDGVWRCEGVELSLTPGRGLLGADVVFPVLHGPFGEDGSMQGLLELLDVAYVGAGVSASAVCMDKVLFKRLMASAGIAQVEHLGVQASRWQEQPAAVLAELERLGLPVFVKPARLGSSVGILKVAEPGGLAAAVESAFSHDPLVIVEAASTGSEVECGVLEGGMGQGKLASEPGEIVFGSDWYHYAAKYEPGGMELLIPARISAAARERVMEMALRVFELTGCNGLARVDFFVEGEQVLVNELNTMPGFTPTSVYAKLLAASGVAYPELVERLCREALERHLRQRAYAH